MHDPKGSGLRSLRNLATEQKTSATTSPSFAMTVWFRGILGKDTGKSGAFGHYRRKRELRTKVVRRQGKSTGFTITELLVVTSVIAVVAAITFPVYRGVVSAAKRTVCINNFTAISRAMQMYTTDYDDRVPPVNYKNVSFHSGSEDRTWVQTLSPYAGDFRLFTCPADTGRGATGTPSGWEGYYAASLRSNLGYNYMYFSPLVQDAGGVWASHPIQNSEIGNPSRTLAFIDSVWD